MPCLFSPKKRCDVQPAENASKYGRIATHLATPLSVFDSIITDDGLPAAAKDALCKMGVEVLVAG